MKRTRRAVLKSGVVGLMVAGTGAAGATQGASSAPRAVVLSTGGLFSNGPYALTDVTIFAEQNGVLNQYGGTFLFFSTSTAENISKNAPLLIKSIVDSGGPLLQPSDLTFVGFDCLQG
jgi:hypothetical protein